MSECFSTGNIIHEKCSDGTSVVRPSDGPKVFLSSSIPNLKFNLFILNVDGFCSELDTNSHIMGVSSFIFDELEDYAGFANTRVANDDELIKVMV